MATRRSTRAASSRAGSVAASDVGPSTPGAPTPRRSGRSLPAVGVRESTSYGSSTAALATEIHRRGQEEDLTQTLADILGPLQRDYENHDAEVAANDSQSIRGRGGSANPPGRPSRAGGRAGSVVSTPGKDLSTTFGTESGIFGDVNLGNPKVVESDFALIQEEPEDEEEAPNNGVLEVQGSQLWRNTVIFSEAAYRLISSSIMKVVPWIIRGLLPAIILTAVLAGLLSLIRSGALTATDLKFSLENYIPHYIAHPLNYFNEADVLDLQKRMFNVEHDIKLLKVPKPMVFDEQAIRQLQEHLPEYTVLTKDWTGKYKIPNELWSAIRGKFLQDVPELVGNWATPTGTEVVNQSVWNDFLVKNEANTRALTSELVDNQIGARIAAAVAENILVSKPEVISMVQDLWDRSQGLIEAELMKLKKEIELKMKRLGQKSSHGAVGFSKSQTKEVQDLSKAVFQGLLPTAQLETLAQLQLDLNAAQALKRINHFSLGQGTVVNPILTSPTYDFDNQRSNLIIRNVLWLFGNGLPTPNPPIEALTKWDEAGDCWCSPARGTGSGVQLGLLLGREIYPDEVVIEHIPKSATLNVNSTPKHMDLLAKVAKTVSREAIARLSAKLFVDLEVVKDMGESWVRIGSWIYDVNRPNHVQSFQVQLLLKQFGLPTRELVVRSRSNYGADYTCIYRVRVNGEVAH